MSFTLLATQSMPIVSQRRISFATSTLVPTLSVHRESAYAPKSTRPVKCPIFVSGLPRPRRRYVSAETRAAMCAAFSSWLTPASAYVWATSHESGRGYFNGAVMVNMLSRQPEKGLLRDAGIVPLDGQGLDQGPKARSVLSRREEAVVPQPGRDQAVPDRPPVWPVRGGRCRRGPGGRAGRLVPTGPRAHRAKGARDRRRPLSSLSDRRRRNPSRRLPAPGDPSRVVRDPPQARGRRHERHGAETERQPVARCGSDPRPGECGALLCGSRVAPQGPVPGEGVPRRRLPRIRSSDRRAFRGDERRQADRFLRDQRGDLRPRGGTPLGGRGARNRPRALQALLGFISVAETGEDLAPVQPGRDVLRTELRRFRVALVRFRESVHPGVDDPFVVPRDRVLGPDMDRLVVAVEGFREQAFLEVDRAEVAPRDLVLRVQPDRVLVAAERLIEAAEISHRDPAGR